MSYFQEHIPGVQDDLTVEVAHAVSVFAEVVDGAANRGELVVSDPVMLGAVYGIAFTMSFMRRHPEWAMAAFRYPPPGEFRDVFDVTGDDIVRRYPVESDQRLEPDLGSSERSSPRDR